MDHPQTYQAIEMANTGIHRPEFVRRVFDLLLLVVVVCVISCFVPNHALAQGDSALTGDVKIALQNLINDTASQADRALLFANNDAINAAGINGTIPNSTYLKAQNDYQSLNRGFAEAAAVDAKAAFTVQAPSSDNPIPGTDSDYITRVKSKDQILDMQESYNRRVNDFMQEIPEGKRPGASSNWHNKLDTDFMADPDLITDPAEFREIARMNNDAYKNRFAAEYERLSRAKDGSKIGPKHVNGYLEEMNEFAQKKGRKVQEILSKPPSYLSDPKNRAELFQAMAQEQKYTSRLESLDDFLRAQEGLPPRNRGKSLAKLGSNRSPGNAANIRRANTVADASRFAALEDLAETMAEVSVVNGKFNPKAADDIAKIVESLPPGRRASALARINVSAGPELVDDILRTSAKAGRLPPGAGSLADDLVRMNNDDLSRLVSNVDDMTDVSRARRVMNSAMGTLDALGRVATAAEALSAIAQMREIFRLREQLLDPDLSDEERQRLIDKESKLTGILAESVGLAVITELSPQVAIVYGAWTVGCMAGEYRSATREGSDLTCGDRQMAAVDHAIDWLSGKRAEDELTARRRCNQFRTALRERRIRLKDDYTEDEVCGYIRYGNSIVGTYEPVPEVEQAALPSPKPAPLILPAAVCDQEENQVAMASLSAAASGGREEAIAHIGLLRSVNAQIASAKSSAREAQQALEVGDINAARASLQESQAALNSLSGKADCSKLLSRLGTNLRKVDKFERIVTSIQDAQAGCGPEVLSGVRDAYANIKHPVVRGHLDQVDAMLVANSRYQDARASFRAGSMQQATAELRQAEARLNKVGASQCPELRQKIATGFSRLERLRDLILEAENAIASCVADRIDRSTAALDKVSNPAAAAVKTRLENSEKLCREQERQDTIAEMTERCLSAFGEHATVDLKTIDSGDPICACKAGYQLNDGKTACLKAPSPLESAEGRNAYCREHHGSGYFAGAVRADGKFNCHADKKTAQAICRRQAKQKKKIYAYTRYNKDRSYTCFWCNPGYRFSKGKCVSKNRRVVRSCPAGYVLKGNKCLRNTRGSAKTGGRRYACTYQNPDGSILGGGGSTSTIYVPSPVRGANCRRIQ